MGPTPTRPVVRLDAVLGVVLIPAAACTTGSGASLQLRVRVPRAAPRIASD